MRCQASNSLVKCLWYSVLHGQGYIHPAHFQNGLPLFCVGKCFPIYKTASLLENPTAGFGIQTLNGITLWIAFSSICTIDIIKPCFEADVFFFLFVSTLHATA